MNKTTRSTLAVVATITLYSGCNGKNSKEAPAHSAPMAKRKPLDSVRVTVSPVPVTGMGWSIKAENTSASTIKLVWDESTFADATGHAFGRLVPDTTRRMDVGAAHPAAPIATGAFIQQTVIAEEMIAWLDNHSIGHSGTGTLTLTFDMGTTKETWQGPVRFGPDDPSNRSFYCYPIDGSSVRVCRRSRDACEEDARTIAKTMRASTIGQCVAAERAFCFRVRDKETCTSELPICEAMLHEQRQVPRPTKCSESKPDDAPPVP